MIAQNHFFIFALSVNWYYTIANLCNAAITHVLFTHNFSYVHCFHSDYNCSLVKKVIIMISSLKASYNRFQTEIVAVNVRNDNNWSCNFQTGYDSFLKFLITISA